MPLFRRKPFNRRLGRDRVLDVKLRSSKVRAARLRMVAVSLGSCFAVLLSGYLGWCAIHWGLDEYIYTNRSFAIQELDIQTDGVISVEQLRRWSGIKPMENLLALDLDRVKRNLQLVSCIELATVEKVPPHTLRIRVFEREPIAQINLARPRAGGGVDLVTHYVDAKGYVLLPLEPSQRVAPSAQQYDHLPTLSIVNSLDAQPGKRLDSPQVQAALQLIQTFERSPMAGLADLQRIDLTSPEVLLVTTGQGSEIIFGLRDHDRQLARWREIFEVGHRAGKHLATLDLAVSNHIPARWVESSSVPQAPVKPVRTANSRKKHV